MTEYNWLDVAMFAAMALAFLVWERRMRKREEAVEAAWRVNQNTLAEIQACFRRIDYEETLLRSGWQRLWHADSILRASIAEHRRQVAAAEAKSEDAEPGTADKTPL